MLSRKADISLPHGMVVMIIIISVFLAIFLGLWGMFISKAEPAAAEKLCETFNAARAKANFQVIGQKITFIPNACKTINKAGKNAIPEEGYAQTKIGAEEDIRKMIVKCWDMWLKGTVNDMFGQTGMFGNNKCFICYTFTLKKDIPPIQVSNFEASLDNTVYFAEDASDKCHLTDQGYAGGYCKEECPVQYPVEDKNSKKCETKKKCCIAVDAKDECSNNGGICKAACDTSIESSYIYPAGWQCPAKDLACCVKKENIYTYRQYVQSYGGQGRIIFNPDINFFEPQKAVYAISFSSKTKTYGFLLGVEALRESTDISTIAVTKLDDVSKICAVQSGASG